MSSPSRSGSQTKTFDPSPRLKTASSPTSHSPATRRPSSPASTRPTACAPPIATTSTSSAARSRPRRRASVSIATLSLAPSTRRTPITRRGAAARGARASLGRACRACRRARDRNAQAGRARPRKDCEESSRTCAPDVPRTAWSEETTATCSPPRRSAARRSISVSASSAQRTSSGPCCSSAPWPSKTSTPCAPLAATQLASRSRSSSGERKPPACRRLKPSNR